MDQTTDTQKITAVIKDEQTLERLIHKLLQKTVARHDISVQSSPDSINKHYGNVEVDSDIVQSSNTAPREEAYMQDDFGWSLGFSFSIPFFIGLVVGIFIVGDIRSLHDNIVYGLAGAVIGGIVGFILTCLIKKFRKQRIQYQEQHGGIVFWVTVHSEQQKKEALAILKEFKAKNIRLEE